VVDGIAKTGKPVVGFGIEGHGDIAVIAKASYVAKEFSQWASELQREKCPVSDLWISTKCGESDTTTGLSSCPTVGNMYDKLIPQGIYGVFGETSEITGAEHLCKARAATPEVGERWYKMWKAYQDDVIEAHKTSDLSDSQPTKGNIAGGLTTIEEKALGNLEKIGRECKYIDILDPAEAPAKGPGLYFMDTSSAAAECVTLMAAGGYVIHTFPTGQGNVIGNPIVPVIKITGNPKTMRTMPEHIDVDVSGILRRDMTISQAGDALIDNIMRTANGRLTAAEALPERVRNLGMRLVEPSLERLSSYAAALRSGWSPNTVRDVSGEQLAEIAADPEKFLAHFGMASGTYKLPDGRDVPRLPWIVRWIWDGEFCGSINFRWQPDTPELPPHVLGHMGYAVVPWKRGRGYAKAALGMMLIEAKQIGLPYVELTTDADNGASRHIIEANGGIYVDTFVSVWGPGDKARYRIDLE
jgi:altronate dehydratase/predicted acetyltransferase